MVWVAGERGNGRPGMAFTTKRFPPYRPEDAGIIKIVSTSSNRDTVQKWRGNRYGIGKKKKPVAPGELNGVISRKRTANMLVNGRVS